MNTEWSTPMETRDEINDKSISRLIEQAEKNNLDDTNPKDLLGIKKPPISLIPSAGLIHEAMAMKNGAAKYGPFNLDRKSVV